MTSPQVATGQHVRPGHEATTWLLATVHDLQAEDPLRTVTVIVPTHQAGLAMRRRIAAEGYANVRFTILARLAESLGASMLANRDMTPITAVTRAALIREALKAVGGPLAASADHVGLVDLAAALARDLRRSSDRSAVVAKIMETGTPTSLAAVATVGEFERRRLDARLYDEVDLLEAATERIAAEGVLADLGAVIVFQPAHMDLPEIAFLESLARWVAVTTADADLSDEPTAAAVVVAPDPIEEVRAAIRDVITSAEDQCSIPLHRTAIVYRDADTYGSLLRDAFDEAGLPYASLDGTPLAESVVARGLIGLIRLRDQDFARAAVLAWLSGLPADGEASRNQARWDQLSRDAGVVRGADQWRDRLTAFADRKQQRLEGLDHTVEDLTAEAHAAALRRDIKDSRRIVEEVDAMDRATRAPENATWHDYADWAQRLRAQFLDVALLSSEDQEADQQLGEVLQSLAQAARLEPTVGVHVFLRTFEDALASRRRPEGRIGRGVVIGPHRLLLGMDFERLHILGSVERFFPAGLPVDPLLSGDPLDRRTEHDRRQRRDWLTALHVGAEVMVSAPAVDLEGRTMYASPWVLRLLDETGELASASSISKGTARHARLHYVGTADDADANGAALSLAEVREVEASRFACGDLASSALARRDDLSLGRSLLVARARRSSELSDCDGNVAAAADLELVARGLANAAQSATGVETWAVCPFRYFLGRVLAVSATPESNDERWWRIDPGAKGTLVHGILQSFYGEVIAGAAGPATDAGVRRMEQLAAAAFSEAEKDGIVGHPLAWENERAAILADLRTLLTKDAEDMSAFGWTPSAVEQPFGYPDKADSWPAVHITLSDGRTVDVRGFIDRVDERPGAHRITDYKTGKTKATDVDASHRFDAGRKLQLPVYGTALRQHLSATTSEPANVNARYWYVSSAGAFGAVPLLVSDTEESLLGDVLQDIDTGVRSGCFPQVPGDYKEHFSDYANCGFCDYDTLCPANRDVAAAAKADSPARAPYNALTPAPEVGE